MSAKAQAEARGVHITVRGVGKPAELSIQASDDGKIEVGGDV